MSFFLPVFFMYNCVRVTRYRSFDISAERCEVDICSAHSVWKDQMWSASLPTCTYVYVRIRLSQLTGSPPGSPWSLVIGDLQLICTCTAVGPETGLGKLRLNHVKPNNFT
jgi:hypothetical protein